ncbi:MerR family transcriptional regulator [Solibacillus sp. FSL K6-1523]|uniref:MerR family transcriptional regulator n=1 Tax=Solibacillus sp. FSL K6-1523 TaxID=2921471 RepID=UPI0030F82EE2
MIILDKNLFTIGELVQKSGVNIRTLRYYDSLELLKPSDYTEGGHRLYSKEDLTLLQKIKALKFIGFPLKEIKDILEEPNVESEVFIKSLTFQKDLFEAKKLEINQIVTNLNHLINITENEEIINVNVFCSMLQKLIFKEDNERWLQEHFSKDITDSLLEITKQEEIDLDKKWNNILTKIKRLVSTNANPSSKEAQETIELLLKLMDETAKGKLNSIKENLPSAQSLAFPSPFTEDEQKFIKQAIAYRRDKKPI